MRESLAVVRVQVHRRMKREAGEEGLPVRAHGPVQKRALGLAPPVTRRERRGDCAHACRLRSRCTVLGPHHAAMARSRIGPARRCLWRERAQSRRASRSLHVVEHFGSPSRAAAKARHGAISTAPRVEARPRLAGNRRSSIARGQESGCR